MNGDLLAIKGKYERELKTKKNVTGLGIGLKWKDGKLTDEPCIVVMVKEKVPLSALEIGDVIPQSLEGVCTDVQIRKAVAMFDRTARWRPVPGGVSVGHPLISAGSTTFCCYSTGLVVGLSNNHVVAAVDGAAIGDPILQPGKHDGGTDVDRIGILRDFEPLLNGDPIMDAGVFIFDHEADARFEILDVGQVKEPVEAFLGQNCQKSGRTTELKKVVVSVIHADVDVSYNITGGQIKSIHLTDQIIADKAPGENVAIQGGDSGSALLDLDNHLVGLCFAGDFGGNYLIANRIQPIMARFQLILPGGPPPPPWTQKALAIGASFIAQGGGCFGWGLLKEVASAIKKHF